MGNHLVTIDMGQKVGGRGCGAPFIGGAASPSNTMSPGPRPTSIPSGILIHPAFWPQQTWAEVYTDAGLPASVNCKSGGAAVPLTIGELGPHLTQCGLGRGLLPYQVAFCSIQPFGHNTPTLQDRQRSDSIKWAILQMNAQKINRLTHGSLW